MGVSRSRDDYRLGEPVIRDMPPSFCPDVYSSSPSCFSTEARKLRDIQVQTLAMFPLGRKGMSAFGSSYLIAKLTRRITLACGDSLRCTTVIPAAIDPLSCNYYEEKSKLQQLISSGIAMERKRKKKRKKNARHLELWKWLVGEK